MEPRTFGDSSRTIIETIEREVALDGTSSSWTALPHEKTTAAVVEVKLRDHNIGYIPDEGGAGTWTALEGGSTVFWPPVPPPLAPAETRRRIAALPIAERCHETCATYFVDEEQLVLTVCDECWLHVPEERSIDAYDVAALPEAQVDLLAATAAACPDIFGPLVGKRCVKCGEVLADPQLDAGEDERCEEHADHRASDYEPAELGGA